MPRRFALQQAIDACGKTGGGPVYVGPGDYTTGQLDWRSGVRLYLEAGATLFASLDGEQFDPSPKSAFISGEDLHDIALEGRGTLDGQSTYERRPNSITESINPYACKRLLIDGMAHYDWEGAFDNCECYHRKIGDF